MLIATNIGEESWDAWRAWAEESEDDLPDAECNDWDAPIVLKPELIGTGDTCILRQGAKMIVVGDSKMGKSYTLIDLAEAICCGGEWLGMQCAAGPVFYVNLEIDPEEFRWRQHVVWDARPDSADDGVTVTMARNFVRWNLRGYACDLEKLAPRLVRRVLQCGPVGTFKAIIIDPIYKVNGGDDNDAKAVSRFTNTIDMIIQSCGCSVIYAHHHPKGATGGRKAIDRGAGSGVYGRDADTFVDFAELFVPQNIANCYKSKDGDTPTMFRAQIGCRSFGKRADIDCMFQWPRFYRDTQGKLKNCKMLGEDPKAEAAERGKDGRKDQNAERWDKCRDALMDAFDNYPHDLAPDVVEFTQEFVDTIRWGAYGLKPAMLETIKDWIDGKTKGAKAIRERFEFTSKSKSVLRKKSEQT